MNEDEVFYFTEKRPEKDFFDVYTGDNGESAYYRRTMQEYYKFTALYGLPVGKWSYTNKDAKKTY